MYIESSELCIIYCLLVHIFVLLNNYMFRPLYMAIFKFSAPPPDPNIYKHFLTEYCTENLKMVIHKGRNM
jgi:hypothetical protein